MNAGIRAAQAKRGFKTGWANGRLSLALAAISLSGAQAQTSAPVDDLQALYRTVAPKLAQSPWRGPVVIESSQSGDRLSGVLMAQVAYPLAPISRALSAAPTLCEVLFLHVYVHACAPSADGITVDFGDRDGHTETAQRIHYRMQAAAGGDDTFRLSLSAVDGPVSTSNYRIEIEVMRLDEQRSFVRFSYRYEVGLLGRLAMQAYLKTAGRSKIGFTEEDPGNGIKVPIGGMRGSLERNLMRYHLAMQAWLDGSSAAEPQRHETRLRGWYQLTEQFARQLHEQSLDDYLQAKRRERRQ